MKPRKQKSDRLSHDSGGDSTPFGPGGSASDGSGGTTGRFLVLFREGAADDGVKMLRDKANVRTLRASTSEGAEDAQAIRFEHLDVAVVRGDVEQYNALAAVADEDSPILAVEPERIVYALDATESDVGAPVETAPEAGTGSRREGLGLPDELLRDITRPPSEISPPAPVPPAAPDWAPARAALSMDYLLGYRDALVSLIDGIRGGRGASGELLLEREIPAAAINESQATWGLQVTKVIGSRYTGKGIRVAVLDTGFDLQGAPHPDFLGRAVKRMSFVPNEAPFDGHGHGTHCIGTALGRRQPTVLPRYGVAYNGLIHAGKVLSNMGSGTDAWILAGINWAIENRCRIVSMSLGARAQPGQPYSQVYEAVAKKALQKGTLIIAAAGNDSNRAAGMYAPVSHPANCPSIMAVGALDANLKVANFSNRGINPQGGRVDIAAPGVNVYSSWPMPTRYRRLNGTSMATPHVAGIAALWAERFPNVAAAGLYQLLVSNAQPLPISSADVGAGLVQAP